VSTDQVLARPGVRGASDRGFGGVVCGASSVGRPLGSLAEEEICTPGTDPQAPLRGQVSSHCRDSFAFSSLPQHLEHAPSETVNWNSILLVGAATVSIAALSNLLLFAAANGWLVP